MKERTLKQWIGANWSGLISGLVFIMVTAFFVDFQNFKGDIRDDYRATERRLTDLEVGTAVHEYNIKQLQERVDELCRRYYDDHIKSTTRGTVKQNTK